MTTNSTTDNPVDIEDLSAFENELFERKPVVQEVDEHVTDEDEESPETELETDEDVDASAETEDNDKEEEKEPEEEPKPKKGRKSFKERIDELTAEKYEARRELESLRSEYEKLKARPNEEATEEKVKETPQPKISADAPKPNAVDAEGEPKYPLGEFDPLYIEDLTRFTIAKEMKSIEEAKKAEAQKREIETAQAALKEHWQDNLTAAEEELPDIREKIATMVDVFSNIEQGYGEYLAGTIMSCDHGPEIMYYLSQNIGEAQNIVASGPTAATLAIGRLEARFDRPQEVKSNKRVSHAPEPPERKSRGTGGRFTVRGDTDNLDAFERDFFGKS